MTDPKPAEPTEAERRNLRRIAQGYVTAYARMVEIGEGYGGLAIRHRDLADLMMEFDQTFTHGQSTILTLLDALDAAEAKVARLKALAADGQRAMDLWWRTTGDDWPVPEDMPSRFLRVVLAEPERDHVAEADAIRKQRRG